MKLRLASNLLASAFMSFSMVGANHASAASMPGLDDVCLETLLKDCTVSASGYASTDGGQRIAFQTQTGFTAENGIKGGLVLFEETAQGWTAFAKAFDGYLYEIPRIVEHDLTLLHVAGHSGNTGDYNADLLFLWSGEGGVSGSAKWRQIDVSSWSKSIGESLPSGFEIWKGVDFDFDDWFHGDLNARTPLWRDDDGNCCPSGGWATIHFAIEDWALITTRVDYQPPQKAK